MSNILRLLCLCGELPMRSLGLLGNVRTIGDLIRKAETPQRVRYGNVTLPTKTQLVFRAGKGAHKTLRLHKDMMEVLGRIWPDLTIYYQTHFPKMYSDIFHIERNHRVAEVLMMAMVSGIQYDQTLLPDLRQRASVHLPIPAPSCYVAKALKYSEGSDAVKKTGFTRIAGGLFTATEAFAVYNSRAACMRWRGEGERKAKLLLNNIIRGSTAYPELSSMILMGYDARIAMETLNADIGSIKKPQRFDDIYQHVHFIPMNAQGLRLLHMLTLPNAREQLLDMLFHPEMRIYGNAPVDCDAVHDGAYILSFLDSDIARLQRFRNGSMLYGTKSFEIVAYTWQVDFLKAYLGEESKIRLRCVKTEEIDRAMMD